MFIGTAPGSIILEMLLLLGFGRWRGNGGSNFARFPWFLDNFGTLAAHFSNKLLILTTGSHLILQLASPRALFGA